MAKFKLTIVDTKKNTVVANLELRKAAEIAEVVNKSHMKEYHVIINEVIEEKRSEGQEKVIEKIFKGM